MIPFLASECDSEFPILLLAQPAQGIAPTSLPKHGQGVDEASETRIGPSYLVEAPPNDAIRYAS